MRVLIGSGGGSGHVGPVLAIVRELRRRGDDVVVAVPAAQAERVAALDVVVRVLPDPAEREVAALWRGVSFARPSETAVLVNRELFGRLNTAARLDAVQSLVQQWQPDLVLHEAAEYAPAIAAHRVDVAHCQIAIGLAKVEWGSLDLAAPALEQFGSAVVPAIQSSPYLTHLPAVLDPSPYSDTRRFRTANESSSARLRPWWTTNAGDPLIYLSLGTIVGQSERGQLTYRVVIEAISDLPVRVLVSLGDAAADAANLSAWSVPTHVRVENWVDPSTVLSQAALVVGHGGAGTTFEALTAGIPLIILPFMADQPTNADLVQHCGAGIRVEPPIDDDDARAAVVRVREAVTTVLNQPAYREAARHIAILISQMEPLSNVLTNLDPTR